MAEVHSPGIAGMDVWRECFIRRENFLFPFDFFAIRYKTPQDDYHRKRVVIGFNSFGSDGYTGISVDVSEAKELIGLITREIERVESEEQK